MIKNLAQRIKGRLIPDYRSKRLAVTSKRLDIAAIQVSESFFLANLDSKYPLRNKVCVEIGSGWVLSHSLIFWLLGAKRIVATDIANVAKPYVLKKALEESVESIIRDTLSAFEDHHVLRQRLDFLKGKEFSFEFLKELGIEYMAPHDLALSPLNFQYDFVFSNSVLEHVPVDDCEKLIANLSGDSLKAGGMMIHRIHLEDHKNIPNDPHGFLALSGNQFKRNDQSERGNRIRASEWLEIFNKQTMLQNEVLFTYDRVDKPLPATIDSSIKHISQQDLIKSNIGIFSVKN